MNRSFYMNNASVQKVKDEINTRTISRYDPAILQLLMATSGVKVFIYDAVSFNWKQHMYGVFFIYLSGGHYIAKLFMLSNTPFDSLIMPITCNTKMQLQNSFIIIQNDKLIYGIWFPSSEEYEKSKIILLDLMAKNNYRIQDIIPNVSVEINQPDVITNPTSSQNVKYTPVQCAMLPNLKFDEQSLADKPTRVISNSGILTDLNNITAREILNNVLNPNSGMIHVSVPDISQALRENHQADENFPNSQNNGIQRKSNTRRSKAPGSKKNRKLK